MELGWKFPTKKECEMFGIMELKEEIRNAEEQLSQLQEILDNKKP